MMESNHDEATLAATNLMIEFEPREIADHVNSDLAPTTLSQRTWGVMDIAALWVSMSACIPTYMLASSLISEGMNWWQAVLSGRRTISCLFLGVLNAAISYSSI